MESHLLQMRGLKLVLSVVSVRPMLSHLLQMRGLKLMSAAALTALLGRIFYRCVD